MNNKHLRGRGRPPRRSGRTESALRTEIASGRWSEGVFLPSRIELSRELGVSLTTLQTACTALLREGTLEVVHGKGTRVAASPQMLSRFLVTGREVPGVDPDGYGIVTSLRAAAATLEAEGNVRFDFLAEPDGAGAEERAREIVSRIRGHHWAGVFSRICLGSLVDAGLYDIHDVPITGFGFRHRAFHGSLVVPLREDSPGVGKYDETAPGIQRLLASCNARGAKRLVVFAEHRRDIAPRREQRVRALAAHLGMEIGPWHYHETIISDLDGRQFQRLVAAVLRPDAPWQPDAIVLGDDHLLAPLVTALRSLFGEEAPRRFAVFCFANHPVLPHAPFPVEFHGPDWLTTLRRFVEWCGDCRHARRRPPAPVVAWI